MSENSYHSFSFLYCVLKILHSIAKMQLVIKPEEKSLQKTK